tara:strand:+ start:570 stop:890 length:321 start_codon:yes stop_codon:yes gene_type:complete
MDIRNNQEKLLKAINSRPNRVVHIDDAVAHTGPFYAVTALEDAVVDVSECSTNILENNTGNGVLQSIATNFTIPKGATIYGNFTSIELDSGSVLAYADGDVTVAAS